MFRTSYNVSHKLQSTGLDVVLRKGFLSNVEGFLAAFLTTLAPAVLVGSVLPGPGLFHVPQNLLNESVVVRRGGVTKCLHLGHPFLNFLACRPETVVHR